jgi:hypothetical protein
MPEVITDLDIKAYISKQTDFFCNLYKVNLSEADKKTIFYYQEEHLKDSHQLSDLIQDICRILARHKGKNGD